MNMSTSFLFHKIYILNDIIDFLFYFIGQIKRKRVTILLIFPKKLLRFNKWCIKIFFYRHWPPDNTYMFSHNIINQESITKNFFPFLVPSSLWKDSVPVPKFLEHQMYKVTHHRIVLVLLVISHHWQDLYLLQDQIVEGKVCFSTYWTFVYW